jgi:hypothetical protein
VGPFAQLDVGAGDPGELGDPQSCLDGDRQQCVIPPSCPGLAVRGVEHRVDLAVGEKGHDCSLRSLVGDGEHLLDEGGTFGVTQGCVSEHRPDRRQPCIARPHRVVPVVL